MGLHHWLDYRWSEGAYADFVPGNCGEHRSVDSRGYLNGAVQTGQRCARERLADLKGQSAV
ncbi:MAG: hypothetical protein V4812_16055 [Pseudomonadota bacterium]